MSPVPLIVKALIGATLFAYGFSVSHFQVFPYKPLQTVKQTLSSSERDVPKSYLNAYYLDRKSFFELHSQNQYDLVFLGDSLTDGAEWQELFPDFRIANRGINGDITEGLLERLDSITSLPSTRVFIMAGINDLRRGLSVEEVFDNYQMLVNQLNETGHEVFIQSTLFVGPSRENKENSVNRSVSQLNELLEQVAANKPRATYIDLNSQFSRDGYLRAELSHDDLHLNGRAYSLWRALVLEQTELGSVAINKE